MTNRYRVEGGCLILPDENLGLLTRIIMFLLPDHYDFAFKSPDLELTSHPMAAYDDQPVKMRLGRLA